MSPLLLPTSPAVLSETAITLAGPLRAPAQMLAEQSYDGHKSVHDGDAAEKLGLPGAPIEGPTHFSQFEPLAASLWGERWFTHGCISSHFLTMVIEGEEVRAQMTIAGPGVHSAKIEAFKADGTPVLSGTASIGPEHGETELSARLSNARNNPKPEFHIIDQLFLGQRDSGEDVVTMGFDDHMGNLYPFTLRQKLETITEHVSYFTSDAQTPWGGPIIPLEMLSVLTGSSSHGTGFKVRQPSVGLFIDLEVRLLNGPVFVGRPYRLEREVVGFGGSKRTESWWTNTTLFDASPGADRSLPVAKVLLHQGVFKASFEGYPGT
jgi:hypothetical protein